MFYSNMVSWIAASVLGFSILVAGCGGGGGGGSPSVVSPGGVDSNAGSGGTSGPASPDAPSILTQPTAMTTIDGGTATFAAAVAGLEPITFRWQRNGADIAGASGRSYTTPLLTLADTGSVYRMIATNSVGEVVSAAASVTVAPVAAAITAQPVAVSVLVGQRATFSVAATGSAPIQYQWRRNGAAIADAVGATYTTAALTLADNGANYNVAVSNPAGTLVTSTAAQLSVTSAAVAPSFGSTPASQMVNQGESTTLSVEVRGTAPLSYQWLRNGSVVPGATTTSLTLTNVGISESGAIYSLRATNAAGSVTSSAIVLSVSPPSSVLAGRTWTAGQQLETDDNPVISDIFGIDDQGRVTVIYLKSNGTRNVLYATQGQPNVGAGNPTWTTPQAIDLLAGTPTRATNSGNDKYGMNVSPNGNVVVYWGNSAPCTTTTNRTSGTCDYVYMARYIAATGRWDAPVLVGNYFIASRATAAQINDRGDVALLLGGWVRSGTNNFSTRLAMVWRANGATALSAQTFTNDVLGNPGQGNGVSTLTMDSSGNMLLVSEATQNATTDIVAYRGSMSSGFGAQQILDTRGVAAALVAVESGRNGQQVVVWRQNNGTPTAGTGTVLYAATSTSATAAFEVRELAYAVPYFFEPTLVVNDSGNAILYNLNDGVRLRWSAGVWTAPEAMPTTMAPSGGIFRGTCAASRNGNLLCVDLSGSCIVGLWRSYDAARNVAVQVRNSTSPGSGFVLGLNACNLGIGLSVPLLSESGVGAATMFNRYDVLPSPTAPTGDRRTVSNLWGIYFR